jgi:uncharacterized protein YcaQ
MPAFEISQQTHRRFVLGAQGLWPGRRFAGETGIAAALREMHALQLDPLNVAARSQDIALYGRVDGYAPELLRRVAYAQRQAFDYGSWLNLYPIETFRFWRPQMRAARRSADVARFRARHPSAMRSALRALRERGPLANRAIEGNDVGEWNYRGRKDTAVALHLLWLLGEVMITDRSGFDRVYDLRERVLPREQDVRATRAASEAFFARHVVALHGLVREKSWRTHWWKRAGREAARLRGAKTLARAIERGDLARVQIEGSRDVWLTLAEWLPLLAELEAGRTPIAWKPVGATTDEEMTLLAPLEIATARGRAGRLFEFDYVWEVYKPAHQRRWGYYTLPVLWGDRLVARLDPRMLRERETLAVLGFWREDGLRATPELADALAAGLVRFARMCGAKRIDARGLPSKLRAHVARRAAVLLG